jgi:RNA polymerase sigma-70 factor (ECF subfamily)
MKAAPKPDMTGFDPVRLIEDHQVGVWRYLRALGCDVTTADDLTQDTFVAVLRSGFQEHSHAATAAYLRKVAHNFYVSALRREGKVNAVANIEDFETHWTRWAGDDNGEELIGALRDCLQTLTQRARQALEMRFRERETRANIAQSLGITEHGAKNLMQRAKKQLKTCIEGKIK